MDESSAAMIVVVGIVAAIVVGIVELLRRTGPWEWRFTGQTMINVLLA